MRITTPGLRAGFAAVVMVVVAGACAKEGSHSDSAAGGATTTAAATTRDPSCAADNAGLKLPDGFCAGIFADSVGRARDLVVAPNGDVYAALEYRPSTEGKGAQKADPKVAAAVAMRDGNKDGKADSIVYIDRGEHGNTGIALADSFLYVDLATKLVRYRLENGALVPTGKAETIVSGIPTGGHNARNVVIDSSGTLYMNVGSPSNSCQVKDRAAGSPGKNPCPELATRAGIWKFDARKTGQAFSPAARYATGIRNGMGLTIANGKLYATQHGRDQLSDWSKYFDAKYSAENPAEELLQVNQGDDFGWPYCYYAFPEKHLVLAPEYGGDGKKTEQCAQKKEPIATYPGHWAPMSLLFYTGSMFPDKYRGGAFIAFHGSWNRAPEPQAGYRVIFQPMSGGSVGGDYETFADNFANGKLQPDQAEHRPVGLAQGPDGALYVADDAHGRIYRIVYKK